MSYSPAEHSPEAQQRRGQCDTLEHHGGHTFGPGLACQGCQRDWWDQREEYTVCKTPIVKRCFAKKGETKH